MAHGALRAPKHCYGGPEPFGTGLGILKVIICVQLPPVCACVRHE